MEDTGKECQISVRLSKEEKEKLNQMSKTIGKKKSDIIRILLNRAFNDEIQPIFLVEMKKHLRFELSLSNDPQKFKEAIVRDIHQMMDMVEREMKKNSIEKRDDLHEELQTAGQKKICDCKMGQL